MAGYVLWRNWPSDSSDSKDDVNKEDEIVETVQQEPFEEKTTIKMVSQEAAAAVPAETSKVENVKKEEIAEVKKEDIVEKVQEKVQSLYKKSELTKKA